MILPVRGATTTTNDVTVMYYIVSHIKGLSGNAPLMKQLDKYFVKFLLPFKPHLIAFHTI